MLKYLLDTTIVSAPVARKPSTRVVRRLEQLGARCAIAAPVWHELVFGVQRLEPGARRDLLDDYLQSVVRVSFPVLPYDEAAAAWHASERARLEHLGRPAPFVDAQIAAIAHRHELTLVTANPDHFAEFQELDVVSWAA